MRFRFGWVASRTVRAAVVAAAFASPAIVQGQGTLATTDGMTLSVSSSGSVSALQVNGVNYGSALASGFFYREIESSSANLATNSSFESGSGTPTGWTISGGTGGSWTIDTSTAAAGSRSMKMTISGTTKLRSPDLYTTARFTLSPNTTYLFSGSMRTTNLSTPITIYLEQVNSSGGIFQSGLTSSIGTTPWKTSTTAITTGPDTVQGFLKIYLSGGYGTVWVDNLSLSNLFGSNAPTAFGGTVTSSGGVLTQTASKDGLTLSAKYTSVGTAIRVDATLTDTTGADRGIQLSYRLPLDIVGWTWDNDFVTPMTIASGTRYENLDKTFASQTKGHTHSVYPFASVHNASAAFALAAPMGPLMDRFSYDDNFGLSVAYDLGLSAATTKSPSKATVSFWIYTHNPKWGMRAAAEKYYALNPSSFTSKATKQGAWVIGSSNFLIASVPNPQDFGWAYNELDNELAFDDSHGIATLHYVSPTSWTRQFPTYSGQPQPPYSVLANTLQTDSQSTTGYADDSVPISTMAASVIATAPYGEDGLYQTDYNSYFWRSSGGWQMYPMLPDPDIPGSRYGIVKQYSVDNRINAAQNDGSSLGGIFLDNISGNFGNVENYRRPLWAYLNTPLSFSYLSRTITSYDGDSIAKFCTSMRSYLNGKSMVLMGSGNAGVYTWFASGLDVLGSEVAGADPVDKVYMRRAMAYGKPWTHLFVPPDSTAPTAAQVLAYLRQALAVGYWPGFNPYYWTVSSAYERDRGLFQKYIPILKTITNAGWRPVNYATPSNPSVFVERFDDQAGDTFYLTAQNSGTGSVSYTLTIDAAGMGLGSGAVTVKELLANTAVSASRSGTDIVFNDSLTAGETVVYQVTVASGCDATYGDLNQDGQVDATDLVILSHYLVGNIIQGTVPFTAALAKADLDRSGTVDAVDLVILQNYLAGNLACLPK